MAEDLIHDRDERIKQTANCKLKQNQLSKKYI